MPTVKKVEKETQVISAHGNKGMMVLVAGLITISVLLSILTMEKKLEVVRYKRMYQDLVTELDESNKAEIAGIPQ